MKRFLISMLGHLGFVPAALSEVKTGTRLRHMEIINPPIGFPARIEWDLDDKGSVYQAGAVMKLLIDRAAIYKDHRCFFIEDSPGVLGKRLNEPDVNEHMVSMPEIYAG